MRNLYRLIPSLQCQESPRSKLSGICPVRTVSQGHPPTHTLDRNYLLSRGYGVRVAAKSSERRTSPQSPLRKGLTGRLAVSVGCRIFFLDFHLELSQLPLWRSGGIDLQ